MFELAAVLITTTTVVVYCVIWPLVYYFWDPKGLRKYDNFSTFSGITDLAYCRLSAEGQRSRRLYEKHRGTKNNNSDNWILRIGPNALSFGHVDAVRDIYGHGTKCTKDVKESVLGGTHTHLFDSVDKAEHARKRKVLSAAFAIKNLERWEFKVASVAAKLVDVFDRRCTSPPSPPPPPSISPAACANPDPSELTIDYNMWINLFTIEAINSIAMSADLGLIDQGSDQVTAERMDGTTYPARYRQAQNQMALAQSTFVWSYSNYHLLARLSRFLSLRWRQVWKEGSPWGDIVYHQASTRLKRHQAGEQLDDFFTALMFDKSGRPNNLEWGEIVAECNAIMNAGSETTAIALSQVLYLLLKNPHHLQTLHQELDSTLTASETVAPYDKVKDLPFLRACLDESLRLLPPTSAALPRRTPPTGAQILNEWIPGDTTVCMTIYGAHRDPSIFPDPESFCPDRWLDPAERRRMEPFFIPFSAGARGCIGRNISYLEQAVMLATLVYRYDFALPSPGWEVWRHEAFNILIGEMPMKIWRRKMV